MPDLPTPELSLEKGNTVRTLALVSSSNRELPYFEASNGKGIAVYDYDEKTGQFTFLSEKEGTDNPHFMHVDERSLMVYAVSEVWGWNEGIVTAYQLDPTAGTLRYINKQATLGSITCYVSLDTTGKYALVANYSWCAEDDDNLPDQVVATFPVRPDGGLGSPISSYAHAGSGPEPRQQQSHAHFIQVTPDNRFVVVADLGIDQLLVYRFDVATGEMHPAETPSFSLAPGSGPRHFSFHPGGRFAYVINEIASTIVALEFDPVNGTFTELQVVSTLPEDYTGANDSADLHISEDGRFIYGSNRGHDSIAAFSIDAETGHLSLVGHQSSLGKKPRNFALDPSGRRMVVANQDSDSLTVFEVDRDTGALTPTSDRVDTGTPLCVKFVRVEAAVS
jgi:6-phosphogluconolactonase